VPRPALLVVDWFERSTRSTRTTTSHLTPPVVQVNFSGPKKKRTHPTPRFTAMERRLDQLRYPRVSVSSIRVPAPSFPDVYHRPLQTSRGGTPSPSVSSEHSSRPSPALNPASLPPFPDHSVPPPVARNIRLSREDTTPTVFGLPLKYVS
jgi:hypothetical protein